MDDRLGMCHDNTVGCILDLGDTDPGNQFLNGLDRRARDNSVLCTLFDPLTIQEQLALRPLHRWSVHKQINHEQAKLTQTIWTGKGWAWTVANWVLKEVRGNIFKVDISPRGYPAW